MVDCLRDHQDPTGSSPGFQARPKPRPVGSGYSLVGSAGPANNPTMDSLSTNNQNYDLHAHLSHTHVNCLTPNNNSSIKNWLDPDK